MWPVHQIVDIQLVDLIWWIFKVKVSPKRSGFSSPGNRNCSSQDTYILRYYIQMHSWEAGYSEGSLTPAHPHSGRGQTVQCLTWGWTIQISFPEKPKHCGVKWGECWSWTKSRITSHCGIKTQHSKTCLDTTSCKIFCHFLLLTIAIQLP